MFAPSSKILIVDDMAMMRKVVRKFLTEHGFSDIQDAVDGVAGWTAVSSAVPPFDLIISDWNMPNCLGIDFLRRVRSDQRYSKTPFVLLTAETEKDQVVEAIKAGVSGYIVKPFTGPGLIEQLASIHAKLVK